MLAKKDREKFPATRMLELEEERAELLEILKEKKESKEEFAEKYGNLAKPEEIDKLFCSREEPCSPIITLDTNMYLNDKALRDAAEEAAMNTLFCDPKECKQVPWELGKGAWPEEESKSVPKVPNEEPVVLMEKPAYFQKVRKYLSELWQQKISTLQRN